MNKTLGIVSLGCAKNQVDSEVMLGLLKDKGYKIVNRSIDAEVIIVNTCGFIETAKEESLNAILEQAKFKKHGKCKTLVVAGCLAERYNKELLEQIPEIDAIVGSGDYMKIASVLDEVNEGERVCKYGSINQTFTGHLPRVVSSSKPTAYLKIAEGCDNRCTYCIIPSLRGEYRSKPLNYVLDEAKNLARQGFKELILVAQDITRYGQDSNGQYDLNLLLRELCKIEGVKWIRLLYAYPDRITKELINTIATEDKICKYLDIPIQHISQKILTSMNRTSNSSDIVRLVKYIREKIPAIVLRTSLIVGFPGESEEDFKELEDFLEEGYFDHVGIFTYSREEGTTAALM
ncbi:MAG: 30S ribosomal protein S12 methylthiotransferase RimO, partial [Caldicoprobacterales bacterium]